MNNSSRKRFSLYSDSLVLVLPHFPVLSFFRFGISRDALPGNGFLSIWIFLGLLNRFALSLVAFAFFCDGDGSGLSL